MLEGPDAGPERCRGAGNIASVHRALADVGYAGPDPWHFAAAADAAADLASAFVDVESWLTEEHVELPADRLEPYVATVVLGSHLEHQPELERAGFVGAVTQRLPGSTIDYVRLDLVARRGVSG